MLLFSFLFWFVYMDEHGETMYVLDLLIPYALVYFDGDVDVLHWWTARCLIHGLCIGVLLWWNYIYIIFVCWKCREITENNKNSGSAGTLPSASGRQMALPSASRRQRWHVAATCATWEHWGWPIWSLCHPLADGKGEWYFAVRRQTAKETGLLTGLLTSGSRRQRRVVLCRQVADGKASC